LKCRFDLPERSVSHRRVFGSFGQMHQGSLLLPPAKPGMEITVINQSANPAATFPSGTDTINGGAGGASVALPTGTAGANPTKIFFCGIAGSWWTK
jgi:hypothetical protein